MLRRSPLHPVVLLAGSLVTASCGSDSPAPCRIEAPPAAALLPAGPDGADLILPGGRRITHTGTRTELGGYPAEVLLHPTIDVTYVDNLGHGLRAIEVVRRSDGALIQTLTRPELWHGMALSPDGTELYVAGGNARNVQVFAIDPTLGTLTLARTLALPGRYPGGMAISPSANVLWTSDFQVGNILEIDRTTGAVLREVTVMGGPLEVLHLPARNELWVSDYRGHEILRIGLATFTLAGRIDVLGGGAMGMVVTPDGSTVYVSVSDDDRVIAIDTATQAITHQRQLGEVEVADSEGTPLPATSPAGLAFDPVGNRLLVPRAGDNVVAVLNAADLAPIATIPTDWYPNDVAIDGTFVVVSNGKGVGAGPDLPDMNGQTLGKDGMNGTLNSFDLATLDLASLTQQSVANWRRPADVYAPNCGNHPFPVPTTLGGPTPIEHIVLIVKENKSYDCVLGDIPGTNGDPSLVMYGPTITPNLHAMAQEFTNHDNFYDDSESSVQGHFWLTFDYVNHYMEHVSYLEDYRNNPGFGQDPVTDAALPDFGSYFQYLIREGVDFRVFGEVVGSTGQATGPDQVVHSVVDHLDFNFPGIFYNTGISDETKALAVAETFNTFGIPQFSYILLPNDHTNGTGAGQLTPESMIADNDYGVGLLVDAISHHPQWDKTAIFIVQDDTQGCADHVDLHRSILLVISPYARRGQTSHVHTSYPSLFRTFNAILGLDPLTRYDALATPLYDSFDTTPDLTPYTVRPRQTPDTYNFVGSSNKELALAQRWSGQIDWTVPDASPVLGDILWLARFGQAPAGSMLARVAAGELPDTGLPNAEEESDGDEEAYEAGVEAAREAIARSPWLRAQVARNAAAVRFLPR